MSPAIPDRVIDEVFACRAIPDRVIYRVFACGAIPDRVIYGGFAPPAIPDRVSYGGFVSRAYGGDAGGKIKFLRARKTYNFYNKCMSEMADLC